MDYYKYLNCTDCQDSGLYCKPHRIEVETELRKMEINKVLHIQNHDSPRHMHAIKGLLESYDIWKANRASVT